jgi:hypothetical protein
MADVHKRMRELIRTIDETNEWTKLSVEDTVAIILALTVVYEAQNKFPGVFSAELRSGL